MWYVIAFFLGMLAGGFLAYCAASLTLVMAWAGWFSGNQSELKARIDRERVTLR